MINNAISTRTPAIRSFTKAPDTASSNKIVNTEEIVTAELVDSLDMAKLTPTKLQANTSDAGITFLESTPTKLKLPKGQDIAFGELQEKSVDIFKIGFEDKPDIQIIEVRLPISNESEMGWFLSK